MSDIQPGETTLPSAVTGTLPGDGTGGAPDPRDQRITELEAQVANLEARVAILQQLPTAAIVAPAEPASFDFDARRAELVAQGASDEDAIAQAAYEQKLHNDQAAQAAVTG